eukprot:7061661-Prymnesium_polylepis.1
MHSGRWAEAAHLSRPNLAPNLKMLSSGRRRAGRFDVGTLAPQLEGFVCSGDRVGSFVAQAGGRGFPQNSEI